MRACKRDRLIRSWPATRVWRWLGIVLVALGGAGVLLGGAGPAAALTPPWSPTPPPCPVGTPEPLWVEPVTSPTDQLLQTVVVRIGNGERVVIETESGVFEERGSFDAGAEPAEVEVSLLPNTTHHLDVTAYVKTAVVGGCAFGGYALRTTVDRLGQPLVIVQLSGTVSATPTPTGTPTPSPRPERTGDLGIKDVTGVVYDASQGRSSPIGGATVFYNNMARFPPGDSGAVVADEEGRFSFSLFLHDTDYVTIRAEAPGFLPASVIYGGLDLWRAQELEIGLAPPSGEIAVEPREMTVTCDGSFDITVTSTGEDALRITQLGLHHGYSQGWYGTGFSWDISHIDVPVSLQGGASLVIPVSYSASGQDFPSRLHLTIDSSAHNEPELVLTYLGEIEDCDTPAPTVTPTATSTPAPCAGDCDGDGSVNIHELVRGVAIVLGHAAMESCPGLDTEGDGVLTVNDLVLAVDRALQGCHGALPDLVPTGVRTPTTCFP